MHQNAASLNIGFDYLIKVIEEDANVLIFAIKERINDVLYRFRYHDMVHILGCSYNLIG